MLQSIQKTGQIQKKISIDTYDPHQDSSQYYLSNPRYFVINGQNAVHYYPLSEQANPALLYTRVGGSHYFALAQSYGTARQPIQIKAQLAHKLKDHQLFSIQSYDKNLVMLFRSRYFHTPEEMQRNITFSRSFSSYFYRSSYELIEMTTAAKILHRIRFTAPTPENGMGFGLSMLSDEILEYTTRTPGDYQTLKPYDIEHRYEYQNGELNKHISTSFLTVSQRIALRDQKEGVNMQNIEDEYRESQRNKTPRPSSCLEDYWVFHDKAAPKNVNWATRGYSASLPCIKFFNKNMPAAKIITGLASASSIVS